MEKKLKRILGDLSESPALKGLYVISKFFVFFSLIYTAFIMFYLRNWNVGMIVMFLMSFYMIFHKIESIDRRIQKLELIR